MSGNMPGLGAMISLLSGNAESAAAAKQAIGKRITSAIIDPEGADGDGALRLGLDDGSTLVLYDEARSCCEARWLTCDDDLESLVGGTLREISVRGGGETGDDMIHEIAFLLVETERTTVTLCSHNEHNGYYGGICLRARLETA